MIKKSRRLLNVHIDLLLMVGVLSLTMGCLPHETLLAKAKRVVNVKDGLSYPYYIWLSDHEVIQMVYHAHGNCYEFTRLDTDTTTLTSLNELNRKYRSSLCGNTSDGSQVAPIFTMAYDSNRLIFASVDWQSNKRATYIATTIDGASEIRWRFNSDAYFPLWLHDNRHWLALVQKGNAKGDVFVGEGVVHYLDEPGRTRRIRIKCPRISNNVPSPLIGITKNDRLLSVDQKGRQSVRSVQVEDYGLLSSPGDVHRYSIPLPMAPCEVSDIALSPRGDRLAWLLIQGNNNQLAQGDLPKPLGLWVSRLDGSGMTEVGHMIAPPHGLGDYIEEVRDLRWLPGGNRLSFMYYDDLYTIDVPADVNLR
jgi:hypothetical protein